MTFSILFTQLTDLVSWAGASIARAIPATPISAVVSIALPAIAIAGLWCVRNCRSTFPDMELNLSNNGLTRATQLNRYPNLYTLDLSNNHLSRAPDLSNNRALGFLNLSDNLLTQAPNLDNNRDLYSLDLSDNRLTQAPRLNHHLRLHVLDLSHNLLTQAPDVTLHPQLNTLYLSHNQLESLPDSIFRMRRGSIVYAENNRFTAAYIRDFQSRLEEHRWNSVVLSEVRDGVRSGDVTEGPLVRFSVFEGDNPAVPLHTLKDEIASWEKEFKTILPEHSKKDINGFQQLFNSLSQENQDDLSRYLAKLRNTKDYKNGSSSMNNVIRRTYNMLELACRNESFRNGMLALIQEGLTSCHDRVLITFNDIEILHHFASKPFSHQTFRDLAIRAQRYEELKKLAQNECSTRGLGDEIETILYFHLKLKDALDLPITTEDMLYPGIAGVTEQMIQEALKKIQALSEEDLLERSDYWQEYVKSQNEERSSQVGDKYAQTLEDSESYFGLEDRNERAVFLKSHEEFARLLQMNPTIQSYPDAAQTIAHLRKTEIAGLSMSSSSDNTPIISTSTRKRKKQDISSDPLNAGTEKKYKNSVSEDIEMEEAVSRTELDNTAMTDI